jgi:hypothetical protein
MNLASDATDFKISTYQLDTNGKFVDEFVCKLCCVHVVGCGPQLTKCSHLFCGDCLQQWFESHQQTKTGVAPCPVCKTSLRQEADIYPVEKGGKAISGFLWRMIQGLRIKSPVSPGTCSDIVNVPTLGEVSTDCSLDGYSTDEKSEGDDSSSPDVSRYQDPVSQDLTSLIKDLIVVTAESQLDQPSPSNHANFKRGLSTVAMPDLAPPPGLSKVALPDLAPPPGLSTVAMPEPAPAKAIGNNRNATKKQQRAKYMVTSSAKSKCATPEEVKAYYQQVHNDMAKYQVACVQQMAKYQMAYAQQCQQYYTAIHAFQMQQYSQQVRMAVGGSM